MFKENERYVRCCADIANTLVNDYDAGVKKNLNLNALRSQFAKKVSPPRHNPNMRCP